MAVEDKYADEIMSDEEFDQVAGGDIDQTVCDSKFLYDYGLVDDWHSSFPTAFHWESYSAAVDAGWAKAGINCVTNPFKNNEYYVDGKKISWKEAYDRVRENFTRIHHKSTYSP